MSAGAPPASAADINQLTAALRASQSTDQQVRDLLLDVRDLLRAGLPKEPWSEFITLQNPAFWKAHRRGYLHLRLLSPTAITVNADVGLSTAVPFALAAATVTEFFLPENSLLTTTAAGVTQLVLALWDDIS